MAARETLRPGAAPEIEIPLLHNSHIPPTLHKTEALDLKHLVGNALCIAQSYQEDYAEDPRPENAKYLFRLRDIFYRRLDRFVRNGRYRELLTPNVRTEFECFRDADWTDTEVVTCLVATYHRLRA
ncbi:MAG: hypothetical protein K8T20_19695 [Planctomycetes bacterium]|nr:hypothetical protein [Planctomycetota bacterium]